MVRAILFDLDGTLWDRDAAFRELSEKQHREFPELAGIPHELYVTRAVEIDNHGMQNRREVYVRLASEFELAPEFAEKLFDHFARCYSDFYEPFPEVLPTLRLLKAQGLALGIITNGATGPQESKIRGLGLAPLMDTVLISDREGMRKPQKEIFERALIRLGVDASSAWFVGDNPDADIRGAIDAGLTAVWRRSWGIQPQCSYTISSLDELIPLLGRVGV